MPLAESCWGILLIQLHSHLQRQRVHLVAPQAQAGTGEGNNFSTSMLFWPLLWDEWCFPCRVCFSPCSAGRTGCASPRRRHQSGSFSSVLKYFKAFLLIYIHIYIATAEHWSVTCYRLLLFYVFLPILKSQCHGLHIKVGCLGNA